MEKTFKSVTLDLFERLTSRTFLILAVSTALLIMNAMTMEEFLAVNGMSYAGTGVKDIIGKVIIAGVEAKKATEKPEIK